MVAGSSPAGCARKTGVGSTHETTRQTRLRLRSFSDVFWRSDAFGCGNQRRAGVARTYFQNPSVDLLVVDGQRGGQDESHPRIAAFRQPQLPVVRRGRLAVGGIRVA